MNYEIKEILDKLKDKSNYQIDCNDGGAYKELFANEIYILLDYITNLQEQLHQASLDIQELTERDIECPSWCDKLTNLQQELEIMVKDDERSQETIIKLSKENERLKELCDKYEEEHSNEFQCWKRDRKELLDKRARIEKANEYINNCPEYLWANVNTKELLNILNGDIMKKMVGVMNNG